MDELDLPPDRANLFEAVRFLPGAKDFFYGMWGIYSGIYNDYNGNVMMFIDFLVRFHGNVMMFIINDGNIMDMIIIFPMIMGMSWGKYHGN
jgi:hypothetical protein